MSDWRKCVLGVVLSGSLLAQSTQLRAQEPVADPPGAADASDRPGQSMTIEWPTGEDIFGHDPTEQVLKRGGVGGSSDAAAKALGKPPKNAPKAIKTLYRMARKGSAEAQYNLGVHFSTGDIVAEDDALAVKWYELAAEKGLVMAQANLALMYDLGEGGPKDDRKAARWYLAAARGGSVLAQLNLGRLYSLGSGVLQDHAQAVKWYTAAAKEGSVIAQYNLGVKFAMGDGVPQD